MGGYYIAIMIILSDNFGKQTEVCNRDCVVAVVFERLDKDGCVSDVTAR